MYFEREIIISFRNCSPDFRNLNCPEKSRISTRDKCEGKKISHFQRLKNVKNQSEIRQFILEFIASQGEKPREFP